MADGYAARVKGLRRNPTSADLRRHIELCRLETDMDDGVSGRLLTVCELLLARIDALKAELGFTGVGGSPAAVPDPRPLRRS